MALLCLMAPADHALAQGLDALAYETIEPSRIKLGESATLRVTSFGRLRDVTAPTVQGLVIEELGRSQGFDAVNGTLIPATFVLFRVTPQFAGMFSIPGLTPNSRSIGLEVVKGDEPNPYVWHSQRPAPPPVPAASLPKGVRLQAGGGAFIHLVVPTRPVYVGENVPIEIDVGLRPGIVTSLNGLPALKGSDFTLNNLSKEPERREEAIDGNDFVVLTWRSALAPVKPGDFPLAAQMPLTAKISTLPAVDRAVASRMAWPLLQSIYSGVAPKDITIETGAIRLKVLSLPAAGQPTNFSGAVGEFRVSSEVSPSGVTEGEPLTLRLHVSGTGNFDRVDSAMLDHLDHWKTYPARSSFAQKSAVGNEGEKVFEQPLIAEQAGQQSIPGLEFTYFNPETRQYEHALTPPIQVNVAPSRAASSLYAPAAAPGPHGAQAGGDAQGLRPDHPLSSAAVSDLRPPYFRGTFLALPAALLLVLTSGWFIARPNPARAGSRAKSRVLARLDAAARANDALDFFDTARGALMQALAARWQIPVDQITGAELKARLGPTGIELERLFSIADEARYAAIPSGGTEFERWLRLIRDQLADGGE